MSAEGPLFPPHLLARDPITGGTEVIVLPSRSDPRRVLTIVPASLPAGWRIVHVTEYPVRVTSTGPQDLRLAVDVRGFDELDLELRVLQIESGTTSFELELQTGMQVNSTVGWVPYADTWRISVSNTSERKNFTNLLRYVRWNVTVAGATPGVTFLLTGIGRRWSAG